MYFGGYILNIKNSLVMLINIVCIYLLFATNNNGSNTTTTSYRDKIIDIAYFIMYIYCVYELVKYVIYNIDTWQIRYLNGGYQTFLHGYHHVDFSIIIAFIFMLGMKRGYLVPSCILAIVTSLILPARTWNLFIMLFIICWIFKKIIYRLTKLLIFNSSFKWFLWLFGAVAVFAFLWINVLNQSMEVVEGHTGLYDTSNFERFQSIWYSVLVIIKEKLLIHGIDLNNLYSNLTATYDWQMDLGPHNSYFSILLYHSILFGGTYLFMFSKIIDRSYSMDMIPYIIPYLLCACILHDMFIGLRFMMFTIVLLVPFRRGNNRYCNIRKIKLYTITKT